MGIKAIRSLPSMPVLYIGRKRLNIRAMVATRWQRRTYGANDTMRVWSGYGYDAFAANNSGLKRAQFSHFFPNAFAYSKDYGQVLPTLAGEDIFFECLAPWRAS